MKALPEAGEGKRGMEGHLGYLLRQAAQAHRNRVERALADPVDGVALAATRDALGASF